MKNMVVRFLMLFALLGCSDDENNEQQLDTHSIYGTWQLIETWQGIIYGDPPLLDVWTEVDDGFTFTLTSSGQIATTNQWIPCSTYELNGNYSLQKIDNREAIVFEFYCPESNGNIEDVEFYLGFENNLLVLSPTNRVNPCAEGCAYKFQKIADPLEGE